MLHMTSRGNAKICHRKWKAGIFGTSLKQGVSGATINKTNLNMKTQNNEELILKYLEKHPNVSAEVISESTGIFKLTVFKILKGMLNKRVLAVNGQSKPQLYCLKVEQTEKDIKTDPCGVNEPKPLQDAKIDKKVAQERQNKAQEESKYPVKNGTRDTSKLIYQDKPYGKGPLVLKIVSDFIAKNPKISLARLKETWPDSLQPRYGFIVETPLAKRRTIGPKERYFWKSPLSVAGKKVVISSQWGAGKHFDEFLEIARKLKFVIK